MIKRLPSVRVRAFIAMATALAGFMNILSALFPAFHWRYLLLRDLVPVRVINDSDVATVLLGVVLILLANGLAKRHRRAMQLTLGVLALSAVLHITKGLDYEEALVCLGLAGILFSRRADYVVPSRPINLSSAFTNTLAFGLLYYAYALIGFRILARWITPTPTLAGSALEPLRLAVDTPMYHYHGYQAHWFGGSLIALGIAAVGFSALLVLRPLIPIPPSTAADRDRVWELIRRFGHDTLSYFALRDDRSYFFDESRQAFLSYKIWRNVALVGGDPVGPAGRIGPLTVAFVEFCRANGLIPCFLGTNGRHLSMYQALGLRVLKIGEEAVIRLAGFNPAALKRKVRRAERHCTEAGISAEMFSADRLPAELREQALRISRGWVNERGKLERGFSMTLGRVPRQQDPDARVLIARQSERVVGFLTFVPVFGANGWSLDMMRRDSDTPNGLTAFMVIQAARQLQSEGFDFMSLNFASLSSTEATIREPRVVTTLRRFLFENLSSVYQLKSLYQFNTKFEPEWASRYLVYGDLVSTGKIIMAVVQAEDPIRFSTLASVFRR